MIGYFDYSTSSEATSALDTLNEVLTIIFFAVMTIIVSYVFFKLRFRLDVPAIAISVG